MLQVLTVAKNRAHKTKHTQTLHSLNVANLLVLEKDVSASDLPRKAPTMLSQIHPSRTDSTLAFGLVTAIFLGLLRSWLDIA